MSSQPFRALKQKVKSFAAKGRHTFESKSFSDYAKLTMWNLSSMAEFEGAGILGNNPGEDIKAIYERLEKQSNGAYSALIREFRMRRANLLKEVNHVEAYDEAAQYSEDVTNNYAP